MLRLILLGLQILFVFSSDVINESAQRDFLDKISNEQNYDKRIMPTSPNGTDAQPLTVKVSAHVLSINYVDDKKEQIQLEAYVRQSWTDSRLKFDSRNGKVKTITLSDHNAIWTPDTFFSTEHKGYSHDLMHPNTFARIFPDGSVLFSIRVTLTLRCPMDLENLPFDTQVCDWRMESYGHGAAEITYKWKEGDALSIGERSHYSLFRLTSVKTEDGQVQVSTGEYSFLTASLSFKRELKHYLINNFIPIVMFVVLSWTAFWIHGTKITARALVGMGTLLTMSMYVWNINENLPKVSYNKAIDYFTGISLTFVFVAFLETCTVHFLGLSDNTVRCESTKCCEDQDLVVQKQNKLVLLKKWIVNNSRQSNKMDIFFQVSCPVLYLLFNLIYWSVCLSF